MIPRIRRPLIKHFNWLTAQPHKLPLERQIAEARHLVAVIIFHEQRQAVRVAEQGALDGDFLDAGGSREMDGLCGGNIGCGGEVEVVVVNKQVEGLGRRGGVGGAEEEGVEF